MSSRTGPLEDLQIFVEGKKRRKTSRTSQAFLFPLCQNPVAFIVWADSVTKKSWTFGMFSFFFFLDRCNQGWWWLKSTRFPLLKPKCEVWYFYIYMSYTLSYFKWDICSSYISYIRYTIYFLYLCIYIIIGTSFYHTSKVIFILFIKSHLYTYRAMTLERMERLR